MKNLLVFSMLLALWLSLDGSSVWAIDVGWMQKGVRVWYFGSAGSGMSSDAEEAYLFASIDGNTAQLTHHSGINHWSLPTAETETGSIIGEGPCWIHPQVLETIAIGDSWRGIQITYRDPPTLYTYDSFKNTSELSSLPYLLLPIKALFDLEPQRELVRLVYGRQYLDPVWGTAYFDADTGLCLYNLRLTVSNTVWFILSEINYNFATHTAFAEDNGPHTGFKSTVLKTKSAFMASHFLQILSSVESRYGGTVQMWATTQAGGASGSYFGMDENYCFFGSVPVLRHKLMSATPNYPPENWNEYGDYLWWWVPQEALASSTINIFDVAMERTSSAPYTFEAIGAGTGLYFSKIIFDNDGYMTDFTAKDPSIGLDLDLGTLIDENITVDGLAYYKNTMGRARPTKIEVVDYDGDGATDVAAFHLPTDQFFTDYAGNLGQYGWGGADCYPVVWDYDGDGATDVSVYHIPTNQWFVQGYPGDNLGQFGWGGDESIPVPGDYNGDGIMERAFYHWPTNRWFVEGQEAVDFGWGGAAFIPLPGDYDGDGTTDMVAYHITSNQWFQYGIGNLGQYGWGGSDCVPVPADYDGDGVTDIAVYHVPTNQWFVRGYPGDNLGQYGWGAGESFPIPGDYDGDGTVERGFYRYAENWWFIEGQSDFVWGWGGAEFMPITSQTAIYNWFRFVLGMFDFFI